MPEPTGISEHTREVLGLEPGAPTLPPPAQPPEIFPGFGKELETLEIRRFQAVRQLTEARKKLGEAVSPFKFSIIPSAKKLLLPFGWTPGFELPPITAAEKARKAAEVEQAKQAVEYLEQQELSVEWRQQVMHMLPVYLANPEYTITKPEDILNYIVGQESISNSQIKQSDIDWLSRTYERMKPLTNILPEGYDGDVLDAQQKLVENILSKPKLPMKAIHNLTVEEIGKYFQPYVTELPTGMTAKDARALLARVELPEEEQKKLDDYISERAAAWAVEVDRINLIRQGLVLVDKPELTPWEFTKLLATQPMMAAAYGLEKYFNILSRPAVSASVIAFHQFYKTPDETLAGRLEDRYNYLRKMGESSWSAYAQAWTETDMPWWYKIMAETAFDPTAYIGWGFVAGMGVKMGGLAFRTGVRAGAGARVGSLLISAERGFNAGADAVFKAGLETVLFPLKGGGWALTGEYAIPKTLTQMSRDFARYGMKQFKAVLERAHPEVRNLTGLTAKQIEDEYANAVKTMLDMPTEGHNLQVKAGASLLEFDYLDDTAARKVVKDVVPDIEIDTPRLARINSHVADMFSGQGVRQTAGKLLADLGQETTEEAVEKVAARLTTLKQQIADSAIAMAKGKNAKDVLINIFDNLQQTRYNNLRNPITQYMEQAGRSASMLSRVADKVLYDSSLVWLERRLVIPVARWNLLFFNFGPWNYGENALRGFLGGGELIYPRSWEGIQHTREVLGGLTNFPYELEIFARGEERRLAEAVVDPKTGRVAVFERGMIPFITKDVAFPDWMPVFGGKRVGKTISLRGEEFFLGSFQNMYDMWSHLNGLQLAYDYQIHFFKAIEELAPVESAAIRAITADRFAELKGISILSKGSDAADMHRTVTELGFRGPEAVRRLADIDVFEMERRHISKELNQKTLSRMTEVSSETKKYILDKVLDGSAFSEGIDNVMANALNAERERSIIALTAQMDALREEAAQYAVNPPKNLTELMSDVENIGHTIQTIDQRLHEYNAATTVRGHLLKGKDKDNFHVGSSKLLQKFMDTADEELDKILNNLAAQAKGLRAGGAVDWDKVTFGGIPKARIAEIKSWIDNLPVQIKINLREVQVYPRGLAPVKGAKAWWSFDTGRIGFNTVNNMTEANLYHELAHAHLETLFNAGEASAVDAAKMLSQFNKVMHYEDLIGIEKITDFNQSYRVLKQVHEAFAEHFSSWLRHPETHPMPSMKAFFAKHFPKRVPEALNDVQLAALGNLDTVSRLKTAELLKTRQQVAAINSRIARTPKRDDAFWKKRNIDVEAEWNRYEFANRRLETDRLTAYRNFLTAVGKPAFVPEFIPEVTKGLTPSHIAYLFGVTGDDVYRGLTRVSHHITIQPREDFILYVRNQADAYASKFGKTAKDIGFTDDAVGDVYDQLWRNLGIEPTTLMPDSPTAMQIKMIGDELDNLHKTTKLGEADIVKWRKYINGVADGLEQLPMYRPAAIPAAKPPVAAVVEPPMPVAAPTGASANWWAKKESAMAKARELHELAFPTYDEANIMTEAGRAIFPFLNYELFRWRWLPRTFMRTPGVLTGLARWTEHTDQGYVPETMFGLQLNPLRGSIAMGGLRSLYLRDYPEYYDKMPGTEVLDYIGRLGFFPNWIAMAPVALFGGDKPEISELTPVWMQSGISSLRALSPQHLGRVIDKFYPDRFRDFQTKLELGRMGYDVDEIWRKMQQKLALTPEEEKLWLKAEAKANGVKAILMQQTGLFRIRPQEYSELRKDMRLAIEEATGVPVATQEWIDRLSAVTGKRFADYYKLDVMQQKLLYEWETYRRWQGVTASLLPSGWQALDVKIADYYQELERVYTEARRTGIYEDGILTRPGIVELNRQLVAKEISPRQWRSARNDILSSLTESTKRLGDSPAYKDVPKTLEEREKLYVERGRPSPTYGPDQELLYYYYELKPEYVWDWEAGRYNYDFDTYYAKIDMMLEALAPEQKERLLQRIQHDWTSLERLYWQVSREYLRPYRNIRSIVLNNYNDADRQAIRRYESASGAEKEQLQELIGPDGNKLVSGFQSKVREAHLQLRRLDADTDAWLCFFGVTDKLLTARSKEVYAELDTKYLVEAMIE